MVPQLTLLAAGLYPWPVLAKLVETAVAAAQQTLLSKVRLGSIPAHITARHSAACCSVCGQSSGVCCVV